MHERIRQTSRIQLLQAGNLAGGTGDLPTRSVTPVVQIIPYLEPMTRYTYITFFVDAKYNSSKLIILQLAKTVTVYKLFSHWSVLFWNKLRSNITNQSCFNSNFTTQKTPHAIRLYIVCHVEHVIKKQILRLLKLNMVYFPYNTHE